MTDIIHSLLLVIVAALLYEIKQEIQGVQKILFRIWDVLPKRVKDEHPE